MSLCLFVVLIMIPTVPYLYGYKYELIGEVEVVVIVHGGLSYELVVVTVVMTLYGVTEC